jgi:DNA-binding response OmpR family regulator
MVKSLRRKLGDDAAQPAYVLNERGVGYRMPRPGSE